MNKAIEAYYIAEREDLVRRMTNPAGDVNAAEDVVQEAFVRALLYWGSFNPEEKELGAWFSTILKNSLRDYKRQEWLFGMAEEFDEEHYEPIEMDVSEGELVKQIGRVVNTKDGDLQEVLKLYYLKQYLPMDIAKITGIKLQTIKKTIWRFNKTIKEQHA